MPTNSRSPYHRLDPFDAKTKNLNVIVDTPKGSRNKFEYDEELGLFKLSGVLPAGANFPYDFGFLPSTRGGDGDPLDVLVLMDDPAFVGCLVPARLDADRPWQSLREALTQARSSPPSYGRGAGLFEFGLRQARMQLHKHRRGGRA